VTCDAGEFSLFSITIRKTELNMVLHCCLIISWCGFAFVFLNVAVCMTLICFQLKKLDFLFRRRLIRFSRLVNNCLSSKSIFCFRGHRYSVDAFNYDYLFLICKKCFLLLIQVVSREVSLYFFRYFLYKLRELFNPWRFPIM